MFNLISIIVGLYLVVGIIISSLAFINNDFLNKYKLETVILGFLLMVVSWPISLIQIEIHKNKENHDEP